LDDIRAEIHDSLVKNS